MGEPKVMKELYIKNKRILSIGKFNFSPSLEQTPKALSSKNSFILFMIVGVGMTAKCNK
jgi:hypothetical protein